MNKTIASVLLFASSAFGQSAPEKSSEVPPAETLDFWSEFTKMSVTLALLVITLLAIAYVFKRVMNNKMEWMNKQSHIQLVERRGLSPKSALVLVEVEGRKILIAESPTGITKLSEYASEETRDFATVLQESQNSERENGVLS